MVARSDTELSQEELPYAAQYTPGDRLIAVNEADVHARTLRDPSHRVEQFHVELEQAEKRLRPLRFGWIRGDRAAAFSGQSEARNILLCGWHFAKNSSGDRSLELLDHARLDPAGPATDQVDVG